MVDLGGEAARSISHESSGESQRKTIGATLAHCEVICEARTDIFSRLRLSAEPAAYSAVISPLPLYTPKETKSSGFNLASRSNS